ncbi:hypothetical protein F11_01800 [Rhodospirillum rubrum F11]|nr:hypothetical protein F11_01800 [Rhodospirillum rubrum F11]
MWCFCELCWRPTEYSTILEAPAVIKRLAGGNAKAVPLTDAIRSAAQTKADDVVARYEQALAGKFGRFGAARMWGAYYDAFEMRGDQSVSGFRDRVERIMLYREWARHGELLGSNRLPGQSDGVAKPSKLYCEAHNPRRGDDARRAYQRDRRFAGKYEELIEQIWRKGINSAVLPSWDIEAHADVRREAYRQLQALKAPRAPISMIDDLLAQGMKQTEIARKLDVSRQAVSAAIKRRAQKRATR